MTRFEENEEEITNEPQQKEPIQLKKGLISVLGIAFGIAAYQAIKAIFF